MAPAFQSVVQMYSLGTRDIPSDRLTRDVCTFHRDNARHLGLFLEVHICIHTLKDLCQTITRELLNHFD